MTVRATPRATLLRRSDLAPEQRELLPDTAAATDQGHLEIAGVNLLSLAAEFGTPLYVYDEATIRNAARGFRDLLKAKYSGPSLVCYAGKAYCAPWLLRLIATEGLGLDVVSGGELFTAIQSAFPAERIYVHGSNKSEEELALALEHRVGRIVVDNFEEIDRLSRLAMDHQTRQSVLLRVAPSVEAHTHEHIKTGALDTKFGVSIETGAAADAVRRLQHAANLDLVGLHAHIGSQIFEAEPYRETIQRIFDFARSAGAPVRELSPGGGFGVRYATADSVRSPESAVETIAGAVRDAAGGSALPMLTIEPGRSIVARAATAVYRVGSVKDIRGVRTYVAVDGGMADNIRPTAYGARYTPVLANRVLEEGDCVVTIAGKYCESGDVLIRDARLPMPRVDDLVAVPVSGAYQLSMASNYNASPRPAVVVVADGKARLVRRRETYADLLAADIY